MKKKNYTQFQKDAKKAQEPNPDNKAPLCNCDPLTLKGPY